MKKTLLFGFAVLAFAACKKNDDNASKTDYLTSGKWYIKSVHYVIKGPGIDSTYDEAITEPCEMDNFIAFAANKTMTSDEGATKCDAADPQTTTGTWNFIDSETKLITQEDGSSTKDTINIVELNGSSLKVGNTENNSGITYTYTISLTH